MTAPDVLFQPLNPLLGPAPAQPPANVAIIPLDTFAQPSRPAAADHAREPPARRRSRRAERHPMAGAGPGRPGGPVGGSPAHALTRATQIRNRVERSLPGPGPVRRQPLRHAQHGRRRRAVRGDAVHHARGPGRADRARPRLPGRARDGRARPPRPRAAARPRGDAARPPGAGRCRERRDRARRRAHSAPARPSLAVSLPRQRRHVGLPGVRSSPSASASLLRSPARPRPGSAPARGLPWAASSRRAAATGAEASRCGSASTSTSSRSPSAASSTG